MSLICCVVRDPTSAPVPGALEAVARACSPQVEPRSDSAVLFDASGLTRALGSPAKIADEVRALAAARDLSVRIALATSSVTAWLLAHTRPGITIVPPGEDAAWLAPLSIQVLTVLPEIADARGTSPRRRTANRARHFRCAPGPQSAARLSVAGLLMTLERWGLRTLGEIARMPRAELHTRFGDTGIRLHQAASGEDALPLVPHDEARPFVERIELEWPIEGLEPLSFVLARLCEALSASLERADRGAIAINTRLILVTRTRHDRRLELPAPMRDARVLRTLIVLDLEAHPPSGGIDVVEIELEVSPGQIVQGSLLVRAVPSTETISTLVARLSALMGASRIGAPTLVDSHDERRSTIEPFIVDGPAGSTSVPTRSPMTYEPVPSPVPSAPCPVPCTVRRYRMPVAVGVELIRGIPVRVFSHGRGVVSGGVLMAAGPWRSSGRWWARDPSAWDRDDWDVALEDGVYRLSHDRRTGRWEIDGAVD